MNHFDTIEAAIRYAQFRPYYHELVMKQIRRFLQFKHKLPKGLDIACGTGLSSKALCQICEQVIACDISENMLNQAIQDTNIQYINSPINQLNFPNNSFDMISIASGIHWMNSAEFFNDSKRLLKPKAWLLVYDHYMQIKQRSLSNWYNDTYLINYPAPARNPTEIKSILPADFCLVKEEKIDHQITFNLNDFVKYLSTQSNISNAIQTKGLNYEEVEINLKKELLPLFKNENDLLPIDFSYTYQLIRKL